MSSTKQHRFLPQNYHCYKNCSDRGRCNTWGTNPQIFKWIFKKGIYVMYLISSCFQIKTFFSVIAKKQLKYNIMLKQLIDPTLWTSRVLCRGYAFE